MSVASERAVYVIDWTIDHGVAIVTLQGELPFSARDKYDATVTSALNLAGWPLLVISIENVEFLDINILSSMIRRARSLRLMGGNLVLFGESKEVTRAMGSIGVSAMLPVVLSCLRDARSLVVECSIFTEEQIRQRRHAR